MKVFKLLEALRRRVVLEGTSRGKNVVAFSGGVDSTLVAYVVHQAYPHSSIACLGVSPSLPTYQRKLAFKVASEIGIKFEEVFPNEIEDPLYVENVGESCYHCKSHLYASMRSVVESLGPDCVLFNGTNKDDRLDETRVGLKAAGEHRVSSPIDFLTKDEVRLVARAVNLSNWNHAASPCLRSRLQFGVEATSERLELVEKAENVVKEAVEFSVSDNLRVRLMANNKALIEVDPGKINEIMKSLPSIKKDFEAFNFKAIDVKAFKSGSLSGYKINEHE